MANMIMPELKDLTYEERLKELTYEERLKEME